MVLKKLFVKRNATPIFSIFGNCMTRMIYLKLNQSFFVLFFESKPWFLSLAFNYEHNPKFSEIKLRQE